MANLGDRNNQTPLMKAAQRDHMDVNALLLEQRARTDLADSSSSGTR
jgi:ankyrin repeat protein